MEWYKSSSSIKPEEIEQSRHSTFIRKNIVEKEYETESGEKAIRYDYYEAKVSNAYYKDHKESIYLILENDKLKKEQFETNENLLDLDLRVMALEG